MPNPSELARIEAEKKEQLAIAVGRVRNLGLSKSSREHALAEVRQLEGELGVVAIGDYNSSSAFKAMAEPGITHAELARKQHLERAQLIKNLADARVMLSGANVYIAGHISEARRQGVADSDLKVVKELYGQIHEFLAKGMFQ